jgi:hypothetical protein
MTLGSQLCDVRNRHLLLRGGQRSTEHGGSDENTVFSDRRMSDLVAVKQRASAKSQT